MDKIAVKFISQSTNVAAVLPPHLSNGEAV